MGGECVSPEKQSLLCCYQQGRNRDLRNVLSWNNKGSVMERDVSPVATAPYARAHTQACTHTHTFTHHLLLLFNGWFNRVDFCWWAVCANTIWTVPQKACKLKNKARERSLPLGDSGAWHLERLLHWRENLFSLSLRDPAGKIVEKLWVLQTI